MWLSFQGVQNVVEEIGADDYGRMGGPQQTSMAVMRSMTLRLTLRSLLRALGIALSA
jgi:hypothetical protein